MKTAHSTIRLSSRVRNLKPSSTLAVTAKVKELRAQGVDDIIGFGAGEPDFGTPEAISKVAADALMGGRTRYETVPGPPDVRKAIASKLTRENGITCTADDIVINAGAKHSIYLAMLALVEAGDEVIIPTPAWVSYRPIVELSAGTVVELPGAVENSFKVTPAQVAGAITAKTRVFMLNSPSNPCGTMYSPGEIRAIVEVIAPHEQVMIISDEIYEKLIYGDDEHLSPGSIASVADRVVTINGLSKAYAMTGWRLGYVCATGRDEDGTPLAKAICRLQGQMNSHVTSFAYPAIIEALEHGEQDVARMREVFARRAKLIHGLVNEMPGLVCPEPTGAFYVFPDVRAYLGRTTPGGTVVHTALELAGALLEEKHVAVVPGEDFGECAATFIRLSFACSDENITEGCGRIAAWLREFK